jgi:3-hydroxybutyryl-CoA dehydrogenase
MPKGNPPIPRISIVAVIGSGVMGRGIAAVTAARGFETHLFDADPAALSAGLQSVEDAWEKARQKEKMSAAEIQSARHRLHGLERLALAAGTDLVIEAIPEALDLKRLLFHELDSLCEAKTVFASNTSSLSISKIASATTRGDRILGLHFFNPVPVMPLVEIVISEKTSEETQAAARAFIEALGKQPIIVFDSPGFATSRLGVALGLEAMRMLEEGVASAADIDLAMEKGYGHAMGPLKTSDLVGLDVRLSIADALSHELSGERFRAPKILRRLVEEGKTGKKSGEGFYRWEGNAARPGEEPVRPGRGRHSH